MTGLFREFSPGACAALAEHDAESFLAELGQPSWFRIEGRDRSRVRAVVTLLHGNEPSGTLAMLRLLQEGVVPEVDLLGCIVRVDLARGPRGLFGQRLGLGERDQNRCFIGASASDRPGLLAAELLALLRQHRPECVVDLHNTSGAGPAYGVASLDGPASRTLTSYFSGHMIHTGLRLGTLMEAIEDELPCATVECGGAKQAASHQTAYDGLRALVSARDLWRPQRRVLVHHHPLRVELAPGSRAAYSRSPVPQADVTLLPDADRHNFQVLPAQSWVGWLGPRGLGALRIRGESGDDRASELFVDQAGELHTKVGLRALMVTTDPTIAQSDCLFYVVRLDQENRV